MLPPWPPSPPDGPPRGTYFSRRNATQPLPPFPAFTNIFASSTNNASLQQLLLSDHQMLCRRTRCTLRRAQKQKGGSAHAEPPQETSDLVRGCVNRRSLLRRMDADEAPVPPFVLKLHDSGDQREKRVVFALTDVHARLMLCAALPHQNGSGVDVLPAEPLHSKPLSV